MSWVVLGIVAVWAVLSALRNGGEHTDRKEQARRRAKADERRAVAERLPDSASAREGYGDALREAGDIEGAIAAYEAALRLAGAQNGGGLGQVAGSGLEGKLRLARFELTHDPVAEGMTVASRQQVCRRCGNLNGPRDRKCTTCGDSLPVDSYFDTLRRGDHRAAILRETAESLAMLAVVTIALAFASGLPLEVKGVLLLSTVIVLVWKGLRRVGGD